MRERALERALALAAALLLPLALRLLPLRAALVLCDRWPAWSAGSGARRAPAALADRVCRWLAHGRGPWAASCLTHAVVLYAMLRQHGFAPCLHVGVHGTALDFRAHAWVTLDARPLLEPAAAVARYRELVVHGGHRA